MRPIALPVLCAALVCAAGCGYPGSKAVRAYYAGAVDEALDIQVKRVARTGDRHRNRPLEDLRLASVAIAAGDRLMAEEALLGAIERVEECGGEPGRDMAAMPFGVDASDAFRGHPYERMMAWLYVGLIRYARRDYESALAAFRKAVDADHAGVSWRKAADAPLACLMAAKCEAHLDRPQKALDAFGEAEEACRLQGLPIASVARETNMRANVSVLVEMGRGPVKVCGGAHGEIVRIEPMPQDVVECKVSLDGKEWRTVPVLESVWHQASTRGGRRIEGIVVGVPAFKEVAEEMGTVSLFGAASARNWESALGLALAGIALIGASAAIGPDADVRTWEMLPGRIAYAGFDLPPGPHSVRLEFYGPDGRRRPDYGAAFRSVEAPGRDETMIWVRALPSRQEGRGR